MGLSQSNSGGGYNTCNLSPIPDHDFTAGPAAPVGGYADLAHGPSPQPPMQEALQHGPSINRIYENYLIKQMMCLPTVMIYCLKLVA